VPQIRLTNGRVLKLLGHLHSALATFFESREHLANSNSVSQSV
jgi:hypothetical protein